MRDFLKKKASGFHISLFCPNLNRNNFYFTCKVIAWLQIFEELRAKGAAVRI
jgi:hypothetical protein